MALFKSDAAADRDAAHGVAAAKADQIDFHIDSRPIDLGLVQGFTTALTDVTGTMQAQDRRHRLRRRPAPDGVVTIDKAAFTVAPTGVSYTNLAGQDRPAGRPRAHRRTSTVLDNHQSSLSITGDLAVHERQVGGVQICASTRDDFKVIDNKMGNVRRQQRPARSPASCGRRASTAISASRPGASTSIRSSRWSATRRTRPTETEYRGPRPPTANAAAAGAVSVRRAADGRARHRAERPRRQGQRAADAGLADRARRAQRHARRRPARDQGAGRAGSRSSAPSTPCAATTTSRAAGSRSCATARCGSTGAANDIDPTLDIRTRRMIQGVEARVNVRGTLKQPEIVLTSTPPLEQADILSLIVFNQPINSARRRAADVAGAARAGAGDRRRRRAAGAVDRQRARPRHVRDQHRARERRRAPQLTIGQQLGQNLYVKVQQGIGDQSQTNFILEYELTEWLRLQTNVLQGSTHAAVAVPARAGQRRRSAVLLQLLTTVGRSSDRRVTVADAPIDGLTVRLRAMRSRATRPARARR